MLPEDSDEYVATSLPGFDDEENDQLPQASDGWEMKKLKPMHLQLCALLAQGMKNVEVANALGITPEYVSMLLRQPLIKDEIVRISAVAGVRLEAMFAQSVEVIGEVLNKGSHADQLKAVRLHGELTKRIGRPDPLANQSVVDNERLTVLAERLTGLLEEKSRHVIEGKFSKEQAEDVRD